MQSSFNWFTILLLVGAAHGILLAVTLLNIRRGNRMANRIFAFILMVFGITIVFHTLVSTEFLLEHPHFSKIEPTFVFLFAPLFYFYAKAMTSSDFRLEKKHMLHFLPFFICIAYLTPYYLQSADYKTKHIMEDLQGFCIHCFIIYWFVTLQIFLYIIVIARILMRYKSRIKESFSSLEKINLDWLRVLLIAVFVTWLATLLLQLFNPTTQTGNIIWLMVSINIYLIGYMGLRQPEVFSGTGHSVDAQKGHKKYERSTLTAEKAEKYLQKLQQVMVADKPFLQSDLTLPTLAKKLSISSHHLSQIINEKLQLNFYDFVNNSRVEEAKKRIADPENKHSNLAEIGFAVGFNSISSFNAAFKKHAGMTPSQFRELTPQPHVDVNRR